MIASKIYFLHEPNVIFNMGAFFNPLTGKFALNGYGRKDSEEFNTPCQVDWTGGMGTLIPLDIIKNVGLFDEKNFPQYYGDADFYLRAKERGFKLIVHPDLKIWNDKSSSGLEHRHKWGLFFRSLTSIRSNNNVFIGFKFRKRHGTSVLSFFYFILGIARHFAGFFKHWLINLFHA
jgi:GT2 family glycosyltransferase